MRDFSIILAVCLPMVIIGAVSFWMAGKHQARISDYMSRQHDGIIEEKQEIRFSIGRLFLYAIFGSGAIGIIIGFLVAIPIFT